MKRPMKAQVPLDVSKLNRLRLAAGLSMDQAAVLAGLSGRQAWHLIESGQKADVKLSTLEALAKAFGVAPAELLSR